jgi:hypothetical protein
MIELLKKHEGKWILIVVALIVIGIIFLTFMPLLGKFILSLGLFMFVAPISLIFAKESWKHIFRIWPKRQ